MTPFAESERCVYDLTPDSIVVDCGAHKGVWAHEMAQRYGCNVYAFEPVEAFFKECSERLKGLPKAQVIRCGISGSNRAEDFHVQGDSSGIYAASTEIERVQVITMEAAFGFIIPQGSTVDVLKMNIEGSELDVLEHIIVKDLSMRFRNIQVQFHWNSPRARERFEMIDKHLKLTHQITRGNDPSHWLNYQLK